MNHHESAPHSAPLPFEIPQLVPDDALTDDADRHAPTNPGVAGFSYARTQAGRADVGARSERSEQPAGTSGAEWERAKRREEYAHFEALAAQAEQGIRPTESTSRALARRALGTPAAAPAHLIEPPVKAMPHYVPGRWFHQKR